jgi:ketosteroid isomerase-like protein
VVLSSKRNRRYIDRLPTSSAAAVNRHPRFAFLCMDRFSMNVIVKLALVTLALAPVAPLPAIAGVAEDKAAVAALDTAYQAAVKANDATTMDKILADDFILVTGKGQAYTKSDLLKAARDKSETYQHQEDTEQTVRVWGDTAVVTALLWIKYTNKDGAADYKLWFSDTYVRTRDGWRYVFGQASLKLP